MTIALQLRRTSIIWLVLAVISFLATIYLSYAYFTVRTTLLDQARKDAQAKTKEAAAELSRFITILKPLTESIVQEMSAKTFTKQELATLFKERKPVEVAGLGVAFLPYRFNQDEKLYAPYITERDGKQKLIKIEDVYDYTKPEHKFFHRGLKSAGFREPYYGLASGRIIVEYTMPFYYHGSDKKQGPSGIAYATQNLEHLKHVLSTLFLGKSGYWFILSKKGRFISHPQDQRSKKQETIFDLAKTLNNDALAQAGKKIIEQEQVFFEYDNEITGSPSWLFSEPIDGTPWSIVGVFDKNELDINPSVLRHNLIYPAIAFLFFIIMLTFFLMSQVSFDISTRWWIASFIISFALALLMMWIWRATHLYPSYRYETAYDVNNKLDLYTYLKKALSRLEGIPKLKGDTKGEDDQNNVVSDTSLFERSRDVLREGFYNENFVPTGIFINNIQFVASNQIQISAYVWQRFVDGLHDDIGRGPLFPQATDITMNEISRIRDGKTETILWELFATLNQFLRFDRYPFDTKALRIQMWHRYVKKNLILTPDMNAYQLINPRSLPGIDDDVYLPGWSLLETHFGYKQVNYTSNFGTYSVGPFGVYQATDKSEVPELYFDILVMRHLVDTLVADLLPIAVIAFLLFLILLTSVQLGYSVIAATASVFFATVVAHVRFRERIPQAQIVYFESFYFIMYFAILLVLFVTILYQLGLPVPFIRYRDNLIAKVLYWPVVFTALVLITMVYLY